MVRGALVGVVGAKRSGKDTLAELLVARHGFVRLAYADSLKLFLLAVNPLVGRGMRLSDVVDLIGWDAAKERPEVRRLLQETGLAARTVLGPGVWLEPVMRRAGEVRAGHGWPVVVTDVRFPNELRAIRSDGGLVVRVRRESAEAVEDSHVSEALWRSVTPDVEVDNNGPIEALEHQACRVAVWAALRSQAG